MLRSLQLKSRAHRIILLGRWARTTPTTTQDKQTSKSHKQDAKKEHKQVLKRE
jgi:hypothetical protein